MSGAARCRTDEGGPAGDRPPRTIRRVGLVVNPVAGLGGSVALKGSDTREIQQRALALGAVPRAPDRAVTALRALAPALAELLVAPGVMGQEEAARAGIPARVVGRSAGGGETTPADTRTAVREMVAAGVELLVFAGGDGTARDVHDALREVGRAAAGPPGAAPAPGAAGRPGAAPAAGAPGETPGPTTPGPPRVVVVGIPAGCKIHSAVYAPTPSAAGELARRYLQGEVSTVVDLEVMDIDEAAFREGQVRARLYGFLPVPDDRRLIQGAKVGGRALSEAAAAQAIAERVVEAMEPGRVYVIGPGTTMRAIKQRMGFAGTLLGVDAFRDGRLVARDATERELLGSLTPGVPASIIVTVIGGQGAILGRGNLQLSPEVIRRVGLENLVIVATPAKLAALHDRRLLVDTGDPTLDGELAGYRRVITGYREEAVLRVE